VVKALLADLVARGLDASDGLLVVIDGAKALSAAVRAVFGAHAAIQRCTVHKRRNIADHLPEAERGWVDTKLGRIFANPDPSAGLRDAKALATALARKHPGAAASLREGLEEMFTVTRLGITGTLARTLTSSNPIVIWSPPSAVLHVQHGRVRAWDLPDGRGYLLPVYHVDLVEEQCSLRGWRCLPRGLESWTVLGDDDVPIDPIERYLAYLIDIERSPNTVSA